MITASTAALVAAAMSLLGTVVPAAFAQVGPQLNFNTNSQENTQTCPAISLFGSTSTSGCDTTQDQGNCQLNVGAGREGTADGTLEGGDCSSTPVTGG
ncbi:MAG TPA: hypothetical protein VGE97_06095 [Nitrososphaera sp.]|jgi:hypothetical protein